MNLIEELTDKHKLLFFVFGYDNYVDEIKISLEIKNKKVCIKYLNIGLDHIKVNSRLIKNNTSYCNNLLTQLGHISSNTVVIECSMYEGRFKFPYCFCSYGNKKIIIIKKDSNNYLKLYEYIKFPKGVFTNQYSIPLIFNLQKCFI